MEHSGTIEFLIYKYFSLLFVTRVDSYKLPIFSEVYYCNVEVQHTYMKFSKIIIFINP